MATKISWTDKTWNPVRGCSRVSAGCDNCYAITSAAKHRLQELGYAGLTRKRADGSDDWAGRAVLVPERLEIPLKGKTPQRIFVNSMSDLFHHTLTDVDIATVFAAIDTAHWHTFQVLTKRPERAIEWFRGRKAIPNVWLGVTAEDQEQADQRIPLLLQIPAALRFVSYEPALGPVDLSPWIDSLDWIICGGESGAKRRPMAPNWARAMRDQCAAAGVPFFFKQHGGFRPGGDDHLDGVRHQEFPA